MDCPIPRMFASPAWQKTESGLWANKIAFADWPCTKEERSGITGILNAWRIRGLDCAADLAEVTGRKELAQQYRAESGKVREAFTRVLWDAKAGHYAASVIDGKLSTGPAAHANVLAAAWKIGSPQQVAGAMRYVEERLRLNLDIKTPGRLELVYLYYTLIACYGNGRPDLAEEVIRSHYGLLRAENAWAFGEVLLHTGKGNGAVCMGCNGAPTFFMLERMLGVQPDLHDPVHRVRIEPESATLEWAEGSVPHPLGTIHVSWRVKNNRLRLDVRTPEGVQCTIQPVGRLAALPCDLTLNGTKREVHAIP